MRSKFFQSVTTTCKCSITQFRVELKNFYCLNQSVLISLFSKFSAFLAFGPLWRPQGQKRPKNKYGSKCLELSNSARNQIKNFCQAKIFSAFEAEASLSHNQNWPFFLRKFHLWSFKEACIKKGGLQRRYNFWNLYSNVQQIWLRNEADMQQMYMYSR